MGNVGVQKLSLNWLFFSFLVSNILWASSEVFTDSFCEMLI